VITVMMLRALILGLLLIVAPALSLSAIPIPITSGQVASALSSEEAMVLPSQIKLLSSPTSRRPNPELRLVSLEPWRPGLLKARIECRDHSECLPFFVGVKAGTIEGFTLAKALTQRPLKAERNDVRHDPVVLRIGAEATLLLESGRIRITVPVICLANGSIGQTIRVTTRDHKQTYQAEVVSAALLRGKV